MVMIRSPSLRRSASGMLRRLPAGDPAEYRSDGNPESRQMALPEDVASHDLARGVEVLRRLAVREEDAGVAVHFDAEIGEGDPGPQGIGRIRGAVDGDRPVALGRIEPLGGAG